MSPLASAYPCPPANAPTTSPPVAPPSPAPRARALGVLLIVEGLLALAPVAILGPAIGWPASLDKPAAEQLAAIAAAPAAVTTGYGVYLLYSILVAPVMIALAARLHGGLASPLGATVAAFAALSALARSIGILRWLTVMPGLATAHAAADPELLGVSLFMALALGTLAVGALRRGGLPRWIAASALVTALALAALALPVFGGPDLMPMALAVSLLSLWMIATGVRCAWGGALR